MRNVREGLCHLQFNLIKTHCSKNYRISTGKASLVQLDITKNPFSKIQFVLLVTFHQVVNLQGVSTPYVNNYLCDLDKYIFSPSLFLLDIKGWSQGLKAARIQMHFFLIISQRQPELIINKYFSTSCPFYSPLTLYIYVFLNTGHKMDIPLWNPQLICALTIAVLKQYA